MCLLVVVCMRALLCLFDCSCCLLVCSVDVLLVRLFVRLLVVYLSAWLFGC